MRKSVARSCGLEEPLCGGIPGRRLLAGLLIGILVHARDQFTFLLQVLRLGDRLRVLAARQSGPLTGRSLGRRGGRLITNSSFVVVQLRVVLLFICLSFASAEASGEMPGLAC